MAWLAAYKSEVLELEADLDEAVATCDDALGALGWVVTEREDGRVSAYEEPSGLSCRTTPSTLEVLFEAWSARRTAVTVKLSAPGIGPVPARRAQRQMDALARRFRRPAAAP